jgi:hypothetical protein
MNLLASLTVLLSLMQVLPPAIATFTGLYRGTESGRIVIEVDNGQSMRMFVIGSTKFIRDGKPSKASQFHDGDAVTVDTTRDVRMNLVAVRVELKPKAPKPPGDGGPGKPN